MCVLTDGGDDDDGVEESAGEGPLDVVGALVAVPPADLHLRQNGVLKVLENN